MKLKLTKVIVVVVVILMLSGCGDAKLPKTAKYKKFLKWLQGLGGRLFGCSIRPIPGAGMGVVADRDIQKGTTVMKIPFTAMIHEELTLVPRDISSALKENEVFQAFLVSHEKKKGNSFWKPYLDILPDDVGLILSFSDDELKEFEGSLMAHFGKTMKLETLSAIDKLLQDLNEKNLFPEITREDLVWATSIWRSRAFGVYVPPEEHILSPPDHKVVGLAPLADIINTAVAMGDSNTECGYLAGSPKRYQNLVCVLTKDVTAGEELLNEYRYDPVERHNTGFLFRYGFVVQNNLHDCVHLKVPTVIPNASLYPLRTALAEELPINKASLYCMNRTKGGNPNILQLIRLMRLLTAESQEIKKSTEAENPFSKPLSVESEKKALESTIYYLEDTLRGYPTTIHEDEVILEQKHLSANVRNAVHLRHGEKSVLLENMDYVHKKLSDLGFSKHPAKSSEL